MNINEYLVIDSGGIGHLPLLLLQLASETVCNFRSQIVRCGSSTCSCDFLAQHQEPAIRLGGGREVEGSDLSLLYYLNLEATALQQHKIDMPNGLCVCVCTYMLLPPSKDYCLQSQLFHKAGYMEGSVHILCQLIL
jgi:hypothetical protein